MSLFSADLMFLNAGRTNEIKMLRPVLLLFFVARFRFINGKVLPLQQLKEVKSLVALTTCFGEMSVGTAYTSSVV